VFNAQQHTLLFVLLIYLSLQHVYLPLLQAHGRHKNWGAILQHSVHDNLTTFSANVQITWGQVCVIPSIHVTICKLIVSLPSHDESVQTANAIIL
jgi:hypothetical protein